MPRITISYRRDNSLGITGRIFDRLAAHYGREAVFRDIDNVPVGVDFRNHIGQALSETDVVIAVIGARWRGPRSGHNRLMNGADPVRIELETALRKEVPLIPLLVMGGTMPSVEQLPDTLHSLAYRNALTIDAGKDFEIHMTRLFDAVSEMTGFVSAMETRPGLPEPSPPQPNTHADDGVSKLAELAKLSDERDALRMERQALLTELAELRERERKFGMELNYTAEESAATQHDLDEAVFAARLEASRQSSTRRMIVQNLIIGLLCAVLLVMSLYAFAH